MKLGDKTISFSKQGPRKIYSTICNVMFGGHSRLFITYKITVTMKKTSCNFFFASLVHLALTHAFYDAAKFLIISLNQTLKEGHIWNKIEVLLFLPKKSRLGGSVRKNWWNFKNHCQKSTKGKKRLGFGVSVLSVDKLGFMVPFGSDLRWCSLIFHSLFRCAPMFYLCHNITTRGEA